MRRGRRWESPSAFRGAGSNNSAASQEVSLAALLNEQKNNARVGANSGAIDDRHVVDCAA